MTNNFLETYLNFFTSSDFIMAAGLGVAATFVSLLVLLFIVPKITGKIFPKFSYAKSENYLPFRNVLDDNKTITVSDKTFVRGYKISGLNIMMHNDTEQEKFLTLREQFLNQMQSLNIKIKIFMIRSDLQVNTDFKFDDNVLQKINDAWQNNGARVYNNDYYIIINAVSTELLDSASVLLESILAVYGPKPLLHNDSENIASMYAKITSPITKPIINQIGGGTKINEAIATDQVEFMDGGIIMFSTGEVKKYGAVVSIKSAPDSFDESFWSNIGTLSCELVQMNGVEFFNSASTASILKRQQSTISESETGEFAKNQIIEIIKNTDENISGNQVLCAFSPTIILLGETTDSVIDSVKQFQKLCAEFGISPVVENWASRVAWFSQFPGFTTFSRSYKLLSNAAAITFPFAKTPVGVANSDWGNGPIVLFPTSQGTPYQFQFHVSDSAGAVAHTLTIGPTGGGKTSLFSFLISQSMRHQKLRSFFFDRNRGAEIFTLATGGKYITFNERKKQDGDTINVGLMAKMNPLQMEDSPANRDFLRRWISMLAGADDPKSMDEIARAVAINYDYLDGPDRRLKNIYKSCFSGAGAVRGNLKKWVDDLQYGAIFNEPADTLSFQSRLTTFDFTSVFDDKVLSPVLISYILHRIQSLTTAQGVPSLIMIDETAPMLENEQFRKNFITGLQEGRKNRQAYISAFQRANILDQLGIGDVVRGQAQTIIFFRNPAADPDDYQHWRLNPQEMAFIQGKLYPNLKRAVLLSRPVNNESVILNTELGGLGSYLHLFESGRKSVLLAEEIYQRLGNEFVAEYLKRVA